MSQAERAAGLRWRAWGRTRPPATPPSAPPADLAKRAATLRRLELDVTRRLDGLVSGDYRTAVIGPGSEPAGARLYGPGDDARRIDWNLTARMVTPHIRTTDADRELETWIVADRSASLDFGTATCEKREVALAAVAAFGFLSARAGNRIGVVIAGGDALVRLPARSGRPATMAALARLYDTPRRAQGPSAGSDLTAALVMVEQVQRRRGQVIIVSDFLDGTDWAAPMRRLRLRQQVIAVQVSDPRESELPAVGMLDLVDTETGARLTVQTNSLTLRHRYADAVAERQEGIRRRLADAGIEHLELSTNRDWVVDVARFVRLRRTFGSPLRSTRLAGPAGRVPLLRTAAAAPRRAVVSASTPDKPEARR